jgi:hypothetical protein
MWCADRVRSEISVAAAERIHDTHRGPQLSTAPHKQWTPLSAIHQPFSLASTVARIELGPPLQKIGTEPTMLNHAMSLPRDGLSNPFLRLKEWGISAVRGGLNKVRRKASPRSKAETGANTAVMTPHSLNKASIKAGGNYCLTLQHHGFN